MEQKPIERNKKELRELANLLKALADETRLSILTMLSDGEMCVCEIMDALPLSQPAVSHHLKVLRQVGLLTDQREGRWIYYDLDLEGMNAAKTLLEGLFLWPLRQREAQVGKRVRHSLCSES